MRARSLALGNLVAAVLLAAAPAHAASEVACARHVAKASAKFVSAALKSTQHCLLLRAAGKVPPAACRLLAASTGDRGTDNNLRAATAQLKKGVAACPDAVLSGMGFPAVCRGAGTRAQVEQCLHDTHAAAVEALAMVQFPTLVVDSCGDAIIQDFEDCDPAANPSGCDVGEVCVAAGSPDACTCVEHSASCGNGTVDGDEECDPAATPTGCPASMNCIAAGQSDECTCEDTGTGGGQCDGSCTPSCGSGETCLCSCTSPTPSCGNGTVDAGEQCDPMKSPNGCQSGQICGAPGTATQCQCTTSSGTCGNGTLDPGENCDPGIPVNNCDPGEVCLASGPLACKCGAPPANCGNGIIEWGEMCDPGATPSGCATGETCSSTCTCSGGGATTTTLPGATTTTVPGGGTSTTLPTGVTTTTVQGGGTTTTTIGGGGCACGATAPSRLSFTTTIGSGNCGSLQNDSGQGFFDLQCGNLYFGGAGVGVPPAPIPDQGQSLTQVVSCAGTSLTLSAVAATDTGATQRNCTAKGCLFGPPLPIANPTSSATSTCIINTVSQDATGTADCSTGASQISLPLSSGLFLDGDLLPDVPGIQPCPICTNGTCKGGPNDGLACTPGDSASAGDAYPTSHDCPPPPANNLGSLPIGFALTTDSSTKTAVDQPDQAGVFCGFCKNRINGAFKNPAVPCTSNADCTNVTGFTSCGQRTSGAFTANDIARTIIETGSPAGNLTDGAAHASTLVSVFCIPPTFNQLVDASADLPGPGAVSLTGQAQLLP